MVFSPGVGSWRVRAGKKSSDAGTDDDQKNVGVKMKPKNETKSGTKKRGEKKPPDSLAVFREFSVSYVYKHPSRSASGLRCQKK
jgi:hypothetical protein